MPVLNLFTPEQAKIFMLILARVSTVLFLFPVFGSPNFPSTLKAGLALVISLLLFPVLPVNPSAFPENVVSFGILVGSEVIIGMLLGLTVRIFFAGVQFAGQLIGFQMGFSMINVVDPQSGGNISLMEQIAYWVVLLIFLAINGHHFLVRALVESFTLIEMGQVSLNTLMFNKFVELTAGIFTVGFKIGAPAIAALVFTDTAFGIAGKFAPQMNVMLVAFPVKIAVGLLFFGIFLEVAVTVTRGYVGGMRELLTTLMVWLGADMAEGETGEKTEDATAKKLADARKEGQVGKSQEVPAVFALLAAVLALNAFAYTMYGNLLSVMRYLFTFDKVPHLDIVFCVNLLYKLTGKYAGTLAPVLAAVFVTALAANFFQVGFMVSWKAIEPKFSKLDPIKGLGQKLSSRSVVELLKAVLKIVIVGLVTYFTVKGELDNIMRLWDNTVAQILIYLLSIAYRIAIRVILVMLLAVLDFAFQKWKFAEDQKMTKQEVKDEYKQSEGDPHVKSRIRQLQREAARKRMMAEVPEADVVVTNPTRLAVAIKYDAVSMVAPKIVAKGAGTVAQRIREIAEENGVPLVENRELARNLYKSVDVGEDVPSDLYVAVAELLAYVYGLKGKNV